MVQGWQVGYIYSYNNLIWGNDIVGEDNNQQIRVEIDEQRLIYTSDYNNIQNFENSDSYQYVGDNTVSFEPSMVDTMGGDYSLDNKSLLIGAGTKSLEGFLLPLKIF